MRSPSISTGMRRLTTDSRAVPATISQEIERQLQRVPSAIRQLVREDEDLVGELLEPLVQAKLGDFDPVPFRYTLLSEVRQAVRADAAQFASGDRQADDGTGWMDHHA
jgi:hypothetical protein